MRAGGPAVCPGEVWHRRAVPTVHEFRYPVRFAWFDPEQPDQLTRHHRLWSSRQAAPVWFRRGDYGWSGEGSLAGQVRDAVAPVLGERPAGPVRMLTQLRRWGWLFNPITVYLVWDDESADPVALVLEVTNTPWKERHHYVAAVCRADGDETRLAARFQKRLHVSPFLGENLEYRVQLTESDRAIEIGVDVVAPDGATQLETAIVVDRLPATRAALGRALWSAPLSTHRVSFGIHRQAWRLWRRRVRVVPHPGKRVMQS